MSDKDKRMVWWREAKFGMFIHWGLYAIPAGIWDGKEVPGIGEWIMKRARIPVKEYEKLAEQFNPTKFNAEEWVQLAKDAGMKYLVITAKHHDGFAMYDSTCSNYDIVDATPFKKDPMKDLSKACEEAGIKFCFYYSHVQDWHHPDGVGNDWDYDESKKNFSRYMREKAIPQVKELLTQYGPIGLIWFDTPMNISKEHAQEFVNVVRELQPDCIINGRVGHNLGDYRQMPDNRIPTLPYPTDWETPATLNDTWGYKKNDNNWKSPKTVIRLLVDINSKGGNYLLNVGPDAEGIIPQPSIDILRIVGRWMRVNGESIYGTIPVPPLPFMLPWGGVTAKPGKLYLHVFDWPKEDNRLVFHGLKNNVKKVYFLSDGPQVQLNFVQYYELSRNEYRVIIDLPSEPKDELDSVIALEIDGIPDIQPLVI
ncbi:MAG: alpha-L-fucosidase [bacterium]|nr:alpha-L-fucosidase [bacterium]